jgi:hypothetical protein
MQKLVAELNKPNLIQPIEIAQGNEHYQMLASKFCKNFREDALRRYGKLTSRWPKFTNEEVSEIVHAVLIDGLLADGSIDSASAEAALKKYPPPNSMEIYITLSLPKEVLPTGKAGRRGAVRKSSAEDALRRLHLDHLIIGSAGQVTNLLKSSKSN